MLELAQTVKSVGREKHRMEAFVRFEHTITDVDEAVLRHPASVHSTAEQRYQKFWQGYFANVNIKERKNPRLHRQYFPQRYWKYFSEKQVIPDIQHLE